VSLEERAAAFERMVLDDAMDEYGLIRHQLTFPDRKPIASAQLEYVRQDREWRKEHGLKWHPLAGTPAYAMYEDANYVGNRYLVAEVWRWLATRDAGAREAAGRAYRATIYPYHEGAKIEPGYWPKPYGALRGEYAVDRNYTETSLDQAYSPVIALWRYYQHLATEREREEIGRALEDHGHWWIRHDYAYDFLGETWEVFGDRIGSPSSALKIPIGQHIAYQITGDARLRDESLRIIRKALGDGAFQMHRGPRGEIKDLYHWAEMYDYFLRETDFADVADWSRLIRECWRAGKSTIQEDGLCVEMGSFSDAGLVERYEPGPIDDVHHGYWKSDARHPASTTQMAALAMLAHELGYDPDAGTIGTMLLRNVTEAHLADTPNPPLAVLWRRAKEGAPAVAEDSPPPLFSTRTVVFWLDAYWRGRRLDVVDGGGEETAR
jgi:hypothetical protein